MDSRLFRLLPATAGMAIFVASACSSEGPESPASSSSTATAAQDELGSRGDTLECHHPGDCRGPLPRVCADCADGERRCAHFECDSNVCVIGLCPAKNEAAQCATASDCRGPLPDLCERCPSGGEACAHFECDDGECDVQTCPVSEPRPADAGRPSPDFARSAADSP